MQACFSSLFHAYLEHDGAGLLFKLKGFVFATGCFEGFCQGLQLLGNLFLVLITERRDGLDNFATNLVPVFRHALFYRLERFFY